MVSRTKNDESAEEGETEDHTRVSGTFAAWRKSTSAVVLGFDGGLVEHGFVD